MVHRFNCLSACYTIRFRYRLESKEIACNVEMGEDALSMGRTVGAGWSHHEDRERVEQLQLVRPISRARAAVDINGHRQSAGSWLTTGGTSPLTSRPVLVGAGNMGLKLLKAPGDKIEDSRTTKRNTGPVTGWAIQGTVRKYSVAERPCKYPNRVCTYYEHRLLRHRQISVDKLDQSDKHSAIWPPRVRIKSPNMEPFHPFLYSGPALDGKLVVGSEEWRRTFGGGTLGCTGGATDLYEWRSAGFGSNINSEECVSLNQSL